MSPSTSRSVLAGPLVAIGVGLVIGALVVHFAYRQSRFAGREDAQLAIHINGIDPQMSRDVLLPQSGWVLEIELPSGLVEEVRDTLQVTLRAERTGAMIGIADQLIGRDDRATLVIPESLGLFEGLLSIRATLSDETGAQIEAYRRVRIRRWLGGPPIGSREVIHFDFGVDRDADGRPDFEADLFRFGLASPAHSELATVVAGRLARRALARVERAYDRADDPNHTGLPRDQVFVRFMLDAEPGPFVTRICVGGANLAHPDSIGNVQFDLRNSRKASNECNPRQAVDDGEAVPVAAGLFPSEFTIYRDSPLYREVLGPFLPSAGGTPIGDDPEDAAILSAATPPPDLQALAGPDPVDPPAPASGVSPRHAAIERAIAVLGDALGTVMAHETAHALGLVPEGKPGVGLFGGSEDDGDAYAHNLDTDGRPSVLPWLMNTGRDFRFEDLAGFGAAGELRFRPLNFAYLKDRVVLVDDHRP